MRAFNYTSGAPVKLYAEERVQKRVKQDFDYAFSEHPYPGVPEIDLHTIRSDEPFSIGQTRIVPIRGIHYKLPVLGFRIGPLAYLTDMNRIDEREIDKIRGVDTLVINALRKEPHLTHVSHQMGRHAEEQAALPEGVYFAYDGLTVEIPE